jgi:hypothetical protein
MNSRNRMRNVMIATIVAALPSAGGCIWTPELSQVKQEIARQIPGATFDHQVSLAIGPGGMALARAVVSMVPQASDARGWLKDVSRVEVAVYEVHRDDPGRRIATPSRIEDMLEHGWEMAARVREDGESVWLLYRLDGESVRELFVVALDRDELVLVKVKGRLERVIARALSDVDDRPHFGHSFRRGT